VYMLEGMGIATGVDMSKLVAATNVVSGLIGRPPVSRVAAALNAKARAAKEAAYAAFHPTFWSIGPFFRVVGTMGSLSLLVRRAVNSLALRIIFTILSHPDYPGHVRF